MAKTLVISIENELGAVINKQPNLRKVFAAAQSQAFDHLAGMPWGKKSPRLLNYTGLSESDYVHFLHENHKVVSPLTTSDRYAIVAAGMLRG